MEPFARNFDGEQYDADSISSPVTNEAGNRIVLVLSINIGGSIFVWKLQGWKAIYMKVSVGFEQYHPNEFSTVLYMYNSMQQELLTIVVCSQAISCRFLFFLFTTDGQWQD